MKNLFSLFGDRNTLDCCFTLPCYAQSFSASYLDCTLETAGCKSAPCCCGRHPDPLLCLWQLLTFTLRCGEMFV